MKTNLDSRIIRALILREMPDKAKLYNKFYQVRVDDNVQFAKLFNRHGIKVATDFKTVKAVVELNEYHIKDLSEEGSVIISKIGEEFVNHSVDELINLALVSAKKSS